MKTTNYEISKKLQQLGFEADFDFCYSKNNPSGVWNKAHELDCWGEYNDDEFVPSYDLETILDALPKQINDYQLCLCLDCVSYLKADPVGCLGLFEEEKKENESLADTAARLLIKLIEEGIINLEEEK